MPTKNHNGTLRLRLCKFSFQSNGEDDPVTTEFNLVKFHEHKDLGTEDGWKVLETVICEQFNVHYLTHEPKIHKHNHCNRVIDATTFRNKEMAYNKVYSVHFVKRDVEEDQDENEEEEGLPDPEDDDPLVTFFEGPDWEAVVADFNGPNHRPLEEDGGVTPAALNDAEEHESETEEDPAKHSRSDEAPHGGNDNIAEAFADELEQRHRDRDEKLKELEGTDGWYNFAMSNPVDPVVGYPSVDDVEGDPARALVDRWNEEEKEKEAKGEK